MRGNISWDVHWERVIAFRYEWQFALAVRNGYAGVIMFHGALLLILISTISRERVTRLLTHVAFVAVTIGALVATFQYDVVAGRLRSQAAKAGNDGNRLTTR